MEWTRFIAQKDVLLPVEALRWDDSGEYGQIRVLDQNKVNYYTSELMAMGDPVKEVEVYVRDLAGMQKSFRLARRKFCNILSSSATWLGGAAYIWKDA